MEEKEVIENLESFKNIKELIQKADQTNYASYREILEATIQDYNRMITDVRIKRIILKNRALAIGTKKALEDAQDYLISYCKSINVFSPQRQELMDVPAVDQTELNAAVEIWNHLSSLMVKLENATKLIDDLKAMDKVYATYPTNRSQLENYMDEYISNAEELLPTLEAPELEELRQQNSVLVRSAINIITGYDEAINDLLNIGVLPFDTRKIALFKEASRKNREILELARKNTLA